MESGSTLKPLFEALATASEGSRLLDARIDFFLRTTESGMDRGAFALREEEVCRRITSGATDAPFPPFTTSLDAAIEGENILCAFWSLRRCQWCAIHRTLDGRFIRAWGTTEPLARRLAGLLGRQDDALQKRNG